jgi:hypothetical protein
VTTAPVAYRAAILRVGLRADALALAGLVVLVTGLAVLTWGTWGDLDSDTGYDVVAGARLAEGELPYRDFTYYYGPLAPALSGLAALIGGPGIWPAVGLGLVIALAIIGMTYALARIVIGPLGAFLAAAITSAVAFIPNNYSFVLPHTHSATLGTLLLLSMLLALWRYATTGCSRWALGLGTALGLLALTKPEPLAAGIVAVLLWLGLRHRARLPVRRLGVLVAAPAVALPFAVYGAFTTVVSPRTLLLENLWPTDELRAGGSTLLRARMPLTPGSLVELGGRTMAYAAGAAALVLAAALVARGGRLGRATLGALVLAALSLAVASALRPDSLREGFYWLWGWIPVGALVAVALLVVRFRSRRGTWQAWGQLATAAVAALTVLAATTYAVFVTHGWRPQMAVYYIPLAAVLLARLHLVELARRRPAYLIGAAWVAFVAAASIGLTLKDARAESATVHGPGGALAETPAEAGLYQAALDEIARRTRPGEPVLVAPLMTGLYVLSGHQSPLPELSMLPDALPAPEDETAAIARLDNARVGLILTDRREWPGYGQTAFGDSFQRLLADWIDDNFRRVRTIRSVGQTPRVIDVWTRRVS